MDFKRLMNTHGLSFWLLASAIGLNLIYQVVLLLVVNLGGGGFTQGNGADLLQVFVLVACFVGPFVVGWIITGMASDGHGPTYGVYGSFGAAVPLVFAFLTTQSILVLLMVVVVLAGGLNGGIFGEYMRHRKG
ncbi:MAG: hypothetical protein ABSE06_05975 [Anaerolineaceae bacterium]|jgi:hypothetical protein